ncbi:Fibroblast growth factor receptor-like 1 [Halotydeus destructor]|nr:Fibroblast growth factor receptor-like 1 [Halotydeus destructor]
MFASSFVICISASLIIICDSYRTGPKRDDNESPKDPIVVKVGSPVVLKCPVYSEYELFYEWSKDSEIIEEFSRYRLKPTGELKIKAASLRDSGMYTCRGVDGFGQDEVNMQLIVTDSKLLTAITELPQAPDSLMVDHLEPSTAPTMVVVGRRRHRAPYFDFPTDRNDHHEKPR